MSNPFLTALVDTLRESPDYQLTAIIEVAMLSSTARGAIISAYAERCWPLLQQQHFSNIRHLGPHLFGPCPESTLLAQREFQCGIEGRAGNALCGWIISALPHALLAEHLSHANVATGADGHAYLLRYHTGSALLALDARRDLPGVVDLLSPIRSWWVPVADPQKQLWRQVVGYDRPKVARARPISLDKACWEVLAGDPLSHRLDELLMTEKPDPALPYYCHGTRLGLIQHYLTLARKQGLSRDDDLLTYVLMIARNGEGLTNMPEWHQALSACREHGKPLSESVQACLHPATH